MNQTPKSEHQFLGYLPIGLGVAALAAVLLGDLTSWASGLTLVLLAAAMVAWPAKLGIIAHPFGVRLAGIFLLGVVAVLTILKFVPE